MPGRPVQFVRCDGVDWVDPHEVSQRGGRLCADHRGEIDLELSKRGGIGPGFGSTSRPEALKTIGQLGARSVGLLDLLDLEHVTVVGNSIGGWPAAEIGLFESRRVSGIIIDGAGIELRTHSVGDFSSLPMDRVFQLNPAPCRFDPTSVPPAAQEIAAGNRAALAVYTGTAMTDPSRRESVCRPW